MQLGLIGFKSGMTRLFQNDGSCVAVTVVKVLPNMISQVKTKATDGYNSVQVATKNAKVKNVTKAQQKHFAKANISPCKIIKEFHTSEDSNLQLGETLSFDILKDVKYVDVTAVSKGKGFTGVIKRHNFSSQDATHGNSVSHNAPGSIGQRQSPGKVFKGKKMAGREGGKQVTIHNLELVSLNPEKSIICIKGAIPGAVNSSIIVKPSVKKKATK